MNFSDILKSGKRMVRANSPALLSGVAVGGVVTTAYLAHKAAQKSTLEIMDAPEAPETFKERTALVWKNYIPAGVSGALTIGCILGSSHISARRGAAAHAALVVSERAYNEYRDKVIDEIGEGKDKKIRDEIAEEQMRRNPPPSQEVLVAGPGNSLFCELYTGRYFLSDMESVRKAVNQLKDLL